MVEATGADTTQRSSPAAVSPDDSHDPARPTLLAPRGSTSNRLTQDQLDFLEFLLIPKDDRGLRDGKSENQWEREHNYGPGTVARWKHSNKGFRAALQARYNEANQAPDRIQEAVDALFKIGVNKGDAKAIMDYLRFTGAYVDVQKRINEAQTPEDMSDEEILAELEEEAQVMRAKIALKES